MHIEEASHAFVEAHLYNGGWKSVQCVMSDECFAPLVAISATFYNTQDLDGCMTALRKIVINCMANCKRYGKRLT